MLVGFRISDPELYKAIKFNQSHGKSVQHLYECLIMNQGWEALSRLLVLSFMTLSVCALHVYVCLCVDFSLCALCVSLCVSMSVCGFSLCVDFLSVSLCVCACSVLFFFLEFIFFFISILVVLFCSIMVCLYVFFCLFSKDRERKHDVGLVEWWERLGRRWERLIWLYCMRWLIFN